MMSRTWLALIALAAGAVLATEALAQQAPQRLRIRGTIETVDGNTLTVKARDGNTFAIGVPDNVRVMAFVPAALADIKPNSYIGITADPQEDGTQKAIAIHIFPEAMRGTAEGHMAWDLRPGTTMTNAAVETTVESLQGQEMTVKYKLGDRTGEQKVLVPPGTPIVTYAPGDRSELKAGAQVIIMNAQRQDDGTLQTQAVNVGRGVTPPM